jgi:DNA-directed RNA polymerase sigma subunit (sigma70/sigma32)
VSNEQVSLLVDLAFEGKPKWVELARSIVANRMLAALSPAEQKIIEAYRSADENGKKTLEMTALLAKGSSVREKR